MCIAIAGVPKTIDNDIPHIDRSFGFLTAVEEAVHAIQSAKVEAQCAPYGVGIVKLMGRHAGFIAAHATLASNVVDCCMLPELGMRLHGANGYLEHIYNVVNKKGHAVDNASVHKQD